MKKSKLITMAISLLAAICLWIYVVTVVNPEGTTTISNIPVTFSGAEVLREDQGLVLSGDYQDMVTVSFTGKNSDMKKLEQNKEEISAVIDVSKIRSTRDYTLSYDLLLPDAVHTLFDTVLHSGCGILALRLYRYLILLFRRQPVIFPLGS